VPHEREGDVQKIDDVVSRYYLRLSVVDRPGTLARIATILGELKIGISSVIQPEGHEGASVPLILMMHDAAERCDETRFEQNRKIAGGKSATGDDPR
jgi:homoserine dehydrogenase